jgi:hypothetical protein
MRRLRIDMRKHSMGLLVSAVLTVGVVTLGSGCQPIKTCNHEAWAKGTMLYTGGLWDLTVAEVRQTSKWKSEGQGSTCFGLAVRGGRTSVTGYWNDFGGTGTLAGGASAYHIPYAPDGYHGYGRGVFNWYGGIDGGDDGQPGGTGGQHDIYTHVEITRNQHNPSIRCSWHRLSGSSPLYYGSYKFNCTGAAVQ